ncbi:MAG: DsrE/DsrF/DrsH-like family protein [Bacteroidales bacterium]|nr:DsrE/DsrF/DrsH-like family protein [Bacteroidales bacterium]
MEENKKMCMALFSGSLDKLTGAGVVISGAAADDMDVEVFILLQAARSFKKEIGDNYEKLPMSENLDLKEEFIASLKQLNVSTWIEFFEMAKELTNVKIHVCSLAGKMWGGEKIDDFIDLVDDICGIGEYLDAAAEADIHLFI